MRAKRAKEAHGEAFDKEFLQKEVWKNDFIKNGQYNAKDKSDHFQAKIDLEVAQATWKGRPLVYDVSCDYVVYVSYFIVDAKRQFQEARTRFQEESRRSDIEALGSTFSSSSSSSSSFFLSFCALPLLLQVTQLPRPRFSNSLALETEASTSNF